MLGFSVQALDELGPVMEAYKKEIANAQPVGAYVNDNIMVTPGGVVAEDRETAYEWATARHSSYVGSLMFRYHDTFPKPPGVPVWPDLVPDFTRDAIPYLMAGGRIMGDPDDALKQCRRWEAAGADQVVFGLGAHHPRAVPRDHPFDGRARDPEDRPGSCSPNHPFSGSRSTEEPVIPASAGPEMPTGLDGGDNDEQGALNLLTPELLKRRPPRSAPDVSNRGASSSRTSRSGSAVMPILCSNGSLAMRPFDRKDVI